MRWIQRKGILAFLLLCVMLVTGCRNEYNKNGLDQENTQGTTDKETTDKEATNAGNSYPDGVTGSDTILMENPPIEDNDFLYEEEDTSVVNMYLTVRQGNASENTNHTWEEINAHSVYYYEDLGIERYQVEGILQVGDEKGPVNTEFGYGQRTPNAIVSIRGQTSSRQAVKSYKIAIKDGKGTWRDQKVINLNKHIGDGVRFRNKLCYDLMEELPGMISMQTQFIHLYVKDETEGGKEEFVDYGLFTQVEQPNKSFLRRHGLDKYGQLYKINFFEFFRYEDTIKLKNDADYNEREFEKLIEIKGDNDHSKLISMLEDLNDYSKPIEEVFTKWFEKDNFFSWMAFHILLGNNDTQSRNTLLYSPLNVNCFYFISWDNDASLRMKEDELIFDNINRGWEYGISNYWGNVLFQRVLKSKEYRMLLDEKIEEYRRFLTKDKIDDMISKYDSVVWKFRNSFPDQWSNPVTNEEYHRICSALPEEIEKNYQLYLDSKKKPMPFHIGIPTMEGEQMKYNWDIAYDFDAKNITYSFELAKDYSFTDPMMKQEGLFLPETMGQALEPGQYFIRVIATNESGQSQYAFDYYVTQSKKIYGTKCFYVLEDGSILEDTHEE